MRLYGARIDKTTVSMSSTITKERKEYSLGMSVSGKALPRRIGTQIRSPLRRIGKRAQRALKPGFVHCVSAVYASTNHV